MPMPQKDKILEQMQGAYYYSCLDLLSGYYQFRMRASDIPYTAFQAPDGLYEYLVVSMGLSNAPATFNDGIRRILSDLVDICQSYFDDIYVFTRSTSLQEHLDALDRVFARLHKHKFFVKLSKCVFCADSIPCLGDIVGRDGVRISPDKVKVIQNWPRPATRHDLQSFLGTAAYFQRFCRRFADDAGPLFNLLKSKNKQLEWTPALIEHFERLKVKVGQTPVLAIPDFGKDFFMRMDASDFAVGGVLYQKEVQDGVEIESPVAFGGRKYKAAELNYSVREKELLATLFGLRSWRVYLLDRPFVVETDHKSLETVFKQKSISRRIARWYDELAEYQFQIRYSEGAVRRYGEDEADLLRELLEPGARVSRRGDGNLGVEHAGVLVLVVDVVQRLLVRLVVVLHLVAQVLLHAAQLRGDGLAAADGLLQLLLVLIQRALLALQALAVQVLAAQAHIPPHRHGGGACRGFLNCAPVDWLETGGPAMHMIRSMAETTTNTFDIRPSLHSRGVTDHAGRADRVTTVLAASTTHERACDTSVQVKK
ncbi:hypothetical protein ON010_g12282 [Phytophthora cinnamomi]|nr:hypothetical protein ON010_g12282 [Phytophthora cinnamomi]